MKIDTAETFRAFGRDLLLTNDLDPLYVGVYRCHLDQSSLSAFLMTYWMFYNAGFSAASVDLLRDDGPGEYWNTLIEAASDSAMRRGTERRHFRGQKAVDAVTTMADQYPHPLNALRYVTDGKHAVRFADVMERAQKWPMFGPWIAFKVADMLDRCGFCSVDANGCDLAMYSTPVAGAELYAQLSGTEPRSPVEFAVAELIYTYKDLRAPPGLDRSVGVYEVETVLCKTKSAANGHYYIGKDTVEIRHHLEETRGSPTAEQLLLNMPSPLKAKNLEMLW